MTVNPTTVMYKLFGRTRALRYMKMRGLIINGPALLKWISTHDLVTSLYSLSSAYLPTPVLTAKVLHISMP